jgi:hypothetical protein
MATGTVRRGQEPNMHRVKMVPLFVLDLIGKVWAAPNTVAGLLLGAVGLLAGSRVRVAHNAIVFNSFSFPLVRGAFVLGNVIINSEPDLNWYAATYESVARRRKGFAHFPIHTVHVGKHEEAHTWQYQVLGSFFLPVYALTMLLPSPTPFEHAADVYAKTGSGWWPSIARRAQAQSTNESGLATASSALRSAEMPHRSCTKAAAIIRNAPRR